MIEIVHYRDPDDECTIEFYIDGVHVPDVHVIDIDPGRSGNVEEWKEAKASLRECRYCGKPIHSDDQRCDWSSGATWCVIAVPITAATVRAIELWEQVIGDE